MALAGVSFLPVLGFGFVYDDATQLVGNANVHTWRGLITAFSEHVWSFDPAKAARYYRPLFVSTLTLAWQAFGAQPSGYHALSLALHLGCGALVWRLGAALDLPALARTAATLIFLLHPVQIQVVAWISAVSDPLLTCLALTSALAWMRWLRDRDRRFLFAALALYVASLLTLERAVALAGPLLLVGWHRLPARGVSPVGHRRLRPVAAQALLLVGAVVGVLALRRIAIGPGVPTPDTWIQDTVLTAPAAVLRYLRNFAWPRDLSLGYPVRFVATATAANFGWPLVAGAGAAALAYWLSRKHPRRRFLVSAGLLTLAPSLCVGLLPSQLLVQDRYCYLPLAFLALWLSDLALRDAGAPATWPIRCGRVMLGVWFLAAFSQHARALSPWRDNLALFGRAVEVAPDSPPFLLDLALEEHGRGLPDHDCRRLRRAASVLHDYPRGGEAGMVYFELGNCLRAHGRNDLALRAYDASLRAPDGGTLQAGINRVSVLSELQRPDDAAGAAEELTRGHATSPLAWRTLSVAAALRGDLATAERAAQRALALEPGDAATIRLLERIRASRTP